MAAWFALAVTDELWDVLRTALPQDAGRPGRPWNDHRLTLEGIIWRFRTGSPWRDLPTEFGAFQSVWQRHRLWSSDGTYDSMHHAVRANARLDGELDLLKVISIDSTSVRAHQHAAGARFHDEALDDDTGGRVESQESARRAS
jgi:transposase